MAVKLEDYSLKVKAAINDTTIAWLHEWAGEITSHAIRNCSTDQDYSNDLRQSYKNVIDEAQGKATIGSPMEQAFWEEFGTGEHADTGKNGGKPGRPGWWVYIAGGSGYKGDTNHYATRKDAERAAAFLRNVKKLDAMVTNGRDPNYTLENAFKANRNKAEADLERRLKEMGE